MQLNRFQRNTHQRRVILEELRESKIHPTAADVYESVRKRLPKISLATVYRTLESLAAMGVIRKLETTGREYRFDGDVEPHHHLRCRICGRFEDIERIPPIVEEGGESDWNGWQILGIRVEYNGICPDCRGRLGRAGGENRVR
jgi:Fur family ferric uptake transcriptional regulator